MLPEQEIDQLSKSEKIAEARQRRNEPTYAESLLWNQLRKRKMYGFIFSRQVVVKGFILDFYSSILGLVVEVDYTLDKSLREYYKERDDKLRKFGLHVLRFKNDEVLDSFSKVIKRIESTVETQWAAKKVLRTNIEQINQELMSKKENHPIRTCVAGGMGSSLDKEPERFDVPRDLKNILIHQARHMRQHPTKAEAMLWNELRGKKLAGFKFRRQHPIRTFIVDFYCPAKKLVIEIDGPVHDMQKEYDELREDYLKTLGYKIIRFDNQQVSDYLVDVIHKILIFLLEK